MTTKSLTNYTKEEKLEIIFSYLFSNKKNLEEEDFWNKLYSDELDKINEIEQEKTFDFSLLKSKII